jgi:hypothetical protein
MCSYTNYAQSYSSIFVNRIVDDLLKEGDSYSNIIITNILLLLRQ